MGMVEVEPLVFPGIFDVVQCVYMGSTIPLLLFRVSPLLLYLL